MLKNYITTTLCLLYNLIYLKVINPVTFLISGLIPLAICWITVSYFTVKSSRINPAETLKNE